MATRFRAVACGETLRGRVHRWAVSFRAVACGEPLSDRAAGHGGARRQRVRAWASGGVLPYVDVRSRAAAAGLGSEAVPLPHPEGPLLAPGTSP